MALDGTRQKCFNLNIFGISVTIFPPWISCAPWVRKLTNKEISFYCDYQKTGPQLSKISSTQRERNVIPAQECPNTGAEITHWMNLHCFIPTEEFAVLFGGIKLLCSDILGSFNTTCVNELWARREDSKESRSTAWEVQLQLCECWSSVPKQICWNGFTDPSSRAHSQIISSA